MITGDNTQIALEVARQLGIGTRIFGPQIWLPNTAALDDVDGLGELAEVADGFAGVKPKHKFKVVRALQSRGHVVGMTGDGVNDSPALAAANVGIAVAGSTDAARNAADIVLTKEGLSTIVKAINRSRMIFRRLESYVIYRIASSVLILLFFFIAIIGFEFNFPTWTLILLSLVNDITINSTSKDDVRSSSTPLQWDIWAMVLRASLVGGICVIQAVLLLSFTDGKSYSGANEWLGQVGFKGVDETCQVVAVIYLDLGLAIQLNIFSARSKLLFFQVVTEKQHLPKSPSYAKVLRDSGMTTIVTSHTVSAFTESIEEAFEVDDQTIMARTTTFWFCGKESGAPPLPSYLLIVPVVLSMGITTVIAATWNEDITLGGGDPMKGCGWKASGGVWVWALLWFVVVEVAKVTMELALRQGGDFLLRANFEQTQVPRAKEPYENTIRQQFAPERGTGVQHAIQAAIEDESLRADSLPSIILPDSSRVVDAQVMTVLTALQQHVASLERRLSELDGRSILTRTLVDRNVRLIAQHHPTSLRGVNEGSEEAKGT